MTKHFDYKSDKLIFRLLITDSDKLLIESRDANTKEVYFNCFCLETRRQILNNLQLAEKIWLGVEAVYKDIIFFHKFPKPDMPGHKGIIAFDIAQQKIIWQNNEYAFSFVYQDKVYCCTQGFEERFYYSLDYLTGEANNNLGSNFAQANSIRTEAENQKDWSQYLYPEPNISHADKSIQQTITQFTDRLSLAGELEWAKIKDLLLFTFHTREKNNKFTNRFAALSITSGKTILYETINENVTALLTDSFFVYKEFLFLLKGKNEVVIYKL
ncbi:MAG: DUF4905 domain-containing protein [Bacteroidota bacterium]